MTLHPTQKQIRLARECQEVYHKPCKTTTVRTKHWSKWCRLPLWYNHCTHCSTILRVSEYPRNHQRRWAYPVILITPITCKGIYCLRAPRPKPEVKPWQLCIGTVCKPVHCVWTPNAIQPPENIRVQVQSSTSASLLT